MTLSEAVRYYRERAGAHLEANGLPIRRRSLLFFERSPGEESYPESYGEGSAIRLASTEEFRSFIWSGPSVVATEASTWAGSGKQQALVAVRGNVLDGFCWFESDYADLHFFDLIPSLPPRVAYFSRVWVLPELRSAGIGRKLLRAMAVCAENRKFQRFLIACDPRNARMRYLLSELGWRYLQRVDYFRIGPYLRYSITPASGRSHRLTSRVEAEARLFTSFSAASHE